MSAICTGTQLKTNKMKTEITQDELEKIKVLNLLMWLQASIYAGDECEGTNGFTIIKQRCY